jgi:hypothetical protein
MHDALPNEVFDPHFYGQQLSTVYFDTPKLELRKNRRDHDKYITLRVRCYETDESETYALSAKTEEEKFRVEISEDTAYRIIQAGDATPIVNSILPAHLVARLMDVSHEQILRPEVTIYCQRYAIEDDQDRFTLDVDIHTDLGKVMPYAVLEFKSTKKNDPPKALQDISLYPITISKFLWATSHGY